MKTFSKFSRLLVLAMTFTLGATAADNAKFSGTVVDAQGQPVAGATVDCYQYPTRMNSGPMDLEAKQHVTTDGQGAFEFPMFNGMGLVLVKKAGLAPGWRNWYVTPQEPQKIVLNASSTLAGTVVDEAGQPVADAEVWVAAALNKSTMDMGQPNFVFGKTARELFSARTSADGKFRIDNFPADAQATLAVKKTGKAQRQSTSSIRYDELPFRAGQTDITLTLDPAGSVSGKITVRGTGQPLANVAVGLEPVTQGMSYLAFNQETTVSAADGSFQISGVPAGSYQVMANFTNEPVADWVADTVPVTVTAGQAVSDVQIKANKGSVLEVTVRGKSSHQPLAEVSVSVNGEGYGRGGETGTNGLAYFRVPPGQYSVYANKQGWSQAQMQAAVTEGETTRVTVELGEPFKITGVVRDAAGVPVEGASVGVFPDYGNGGSGAKTDASGHYELDWQKPSWAGSQNQIFYLLARHLERKLAAMQPIEETTKSVDLTLKPAMSVTGHVQDTKGKAVTNVVAYISLHQENSSFTITRQPVHSDEQGRIEADALPLGERYGWFVSAQGYGGGQQEMDAADPKADHYDFPPLIVKLANRKLAGRVLGTNGAPVAGVQIFMQGQGQPNGNAVTGTDGRFSFDAVCEGPVTVSANMMNAYGSADAMGGDTNVVIRFEAQNRNMYMAQTPQTLTGTVYDASGHPAVGVRVVVTPTWGNIDNSKTDTNGEYSVNWQPQMGMRNAKYFAIARDVERNLAAIEAIDTNKNRVTLRLEPGLTISGTVLDAKGAPLPRANINLNMISGNMGGMVEYEPIKMGSDGTFTIPALPMGQQYQVYVMANGFGSARKAVGKTQSQTNSLKLAPFKLKAADRPLAGLVLGTDGKPLSGARVNINGDGQPNGNVSTDATGHFKFTVCAGPVSIFAYLSNGSGRNNSGNTQARGGDTNVVVKMGAQPQPRQVVVQREIPLKPQPWTLNALVTWPANHKTGAIILLSLQAAALLGTAGGVFWFTRKRGQGKS
jgi:protocatechuate 3,4-dioxygenase beta subunit